LALEFPAAFSHSTAAFRAHAIQNAGDDICAWLYVAASHEMHTHLANEYFSCRTLCPAKTAVGTEAELKTMSAFRFPKEHNQIDVVEHRFQEAQSSSRTTGN